MGDLLQSHLTYDGAFRVYNTAGGGYDNATMGNGGRGLAYNPTTGRLITFSSRGSSPTDGATASTYSALLRYSTDASEARRTRQTLGSSTSSSLRVSGLNQLNGRSFTSTR